MARQVCPVAVTPILMDTEVLFPHLLPFPSISDHTLTAIIPVLSLYTIHVALDISSDIFSPYKSPRLRDEMSVFSIVGLVVFPFRRFCMHTLYCINM